MNPFDLPGPQFLLVYIIFAGLVISGLVFARRRAELSPSTARIDLSDPYLIAFLRGGEKEVLRVATVTLIQRGLLVRDGKQIQRAENSSPNSVRIPIEQALLKKYARSGKVSWMFEDDGLSLACEPYARTLQRARLLPDDYVHRGRLVRLVIATFLLTGVGFTKVMIALDAGRTNVGFLIVLIVASLIIAMAPSTVAADRGGAARCPISIPPPRTNARCSDHETGLTSSQSRAISSSRFVSTGTDEAIPSDTPCSVSGVCAPSVRNARRSRCGARK